MQENKALIKLLIKTINQNVSNLQDDILGQKINDIADINFNSGVIRGLLSAIDIIHSKSEKIEQGMLTLIRDRGKFYYFCEKTKERYEI